MPYKAKFSMPLLIILSAVLTSCTTVRIEPGEINSSVKRLDETNRRSIFLSSTAQNDFTSAGHQYLFFVIPFGKVIVEAPELSVFNETATKLAIAGYRIKADPNLQTRLNLKITDLQLTAYDLLFLRKIYCNLEVQGEFYDLARQKKIILSGRGEKASYKVTAFKPQLEYVFSQCLDQAINQVLHGIY